MLERRLPKNQARIEPLFARYCFSRPVEGRWAPMRSTRGVADVLRDPAGQPYWLSQNTIDDLMARLAVEPVRLPSYAPGTRLRVLDGPLATFTGTVVADAGERVRLLHSLFGRATEKWYQPEDVEAA
jgi:transcription antitermination factor NusG